MKIIKDSLWSSCLTFLISIISFGSQLLIAKYFGTSTELDAFLATTSFPTLISALIASGFNYAVFPELVKRKNLYRNNLEAFIFVLFISTTLIFGILIPIIYFSFYALLPIQFVKVYKLNVNNNLMFFLWLNSFFTILVSLTNCFFNAINKFKIPILLSFVSYSVSILIIYFFNSKYGIISIAMGLLLGTFISLLISIFFIFAKKKITINFNSMTHDALGLIKKIPFAAVSMLSFSIYQTVDTFWATRLGESNLSYLGYGQRIIIAFGALIIAGPFTVFVPKLTNDYTKSDNQNFYFNIVSLIKLLILFSLIVSLLFSMFSETIISILFERGKFTKIDTENLSLIIPYLMIGMIFMLCSAIVYRVFFITNNEKRAIILSVITTISYIIFSGLFSKYFSLIGICYAYILTWFITFLLGVLMIFKNRIKTNFSKLFFKDISISFIIILLLFSLIKITRIFYVQYNYPVWKDYLIILFISIVSFTTYIYALFKCNISEIKILINYFLLKSKIEQ